MSKSVVRTQERRKKQALQDVLVRMHGGDEERHEAHKAEPEVGLACLSWCGRSHQRYQPSIAGGQQAPGNFHVTMSHVR
jgi:hypothetical protein